MLEGWVAGGVKSHRREGSICNEDACTDCTRAHFHVARPECILSTTIWCVRLIFVVLLSQTCLSICIKMQQSCVHVRERPMHSSRPSLALLVSKLRVLDIFVA